MEFFFGYFLCLVLYNRFASMLFTNFCWSFLFKTRAIYQIISFKMKRKYQKKSFYYLRFQASLQTFQNLLSLSVFDFFFAIHNLPLALLSLAFTSHRNSVSSDCRLQLGFLQLIEVHDLFFEFSSFLQPLEYHHVQFWYFIFATADSFFHWH